MPHMFDYTDCNPIAIVGPPVVAASRLSSRLTESERQAGQETGSPP